jgi:hypothetical protein
MMHFDDFQVKVRTKDFGSLAGQPEEGVDPDTEVRRENDWELLGGCGYFFPRGVILPGGANDEAFVLLQAKVNHLAGDSRMAEINHPIRSGKSGGQIVSSIDCRNNFQFGVSRGTLEQSLPHATTGAIDDNAGGRSAHGEEKRRF